MAAKDTYVDGNAWNATESNNFAKAINGSGWMVPCRFSTVGTETFTVSSGSITQITGTTLDGGSPGVGDRILIKDAPTSTGVGSAFSLKPGNGIYSVTNATTNLTVSRVTEMAGTYVPAGYLVRIMAGTQHGGDGFMVTTPNSPAAFTYGTGNIQFTKQISANLANGAAGAFVVTSESTSSTSYTDLATTTDTVTVTVGSSGKVMVEISAFMYNDTGSQFAFMSFALSGANTVAAADTFKIAYQSPTANHGAEFGRTFLLGSPTPLTPGSTTFKAKYRVLANTGTYSNRRIHVIPL